ncbi:hypothetical protein JNW90_30440 [Micromonospora sp. STR1s_5]|nr:hypothetical protein [Micromonospora sp. STR1s_5]
MNDNELSLDLSNRTPLLEARNRQCRYIVSDDLKEAICCGNETTSDISSWCSYHRRLVYEPRVSRHEKQRIAA